MSVNIHFDTGSLTKEEGTGLTAFLSAVQPSLPTAAELREQESRYRFGPVSGLLGENAYRQAGAPTATYVAEAVNTDAPASQTEAGIPVSEAPKRERGKPAPGRARRTKEEIAEDEAADKADASNVAGWVGEDDGKTTATLGIQSGGERIDPQDAADEAAEDEANREPEKPLTADDVKNAVGLYVTKFGMDAAQADGPNVFADTLGSPPAGQQYWKFSILPTDQASLKKMVDAWTAAAAADARYKRKGA